MGSFESAELLTNELSQSYPAHICDEGLDIILHNAWLVGLALRVLIWLSHLAFVMVQS